MKHIGIAAITAEGAALCYRMVCSEASKRFGSHIHPEVSLHCFSFQKIFSAQMKEDWKTVADVVVASLDKLKKSGAEFGIIPANSTHFVFDDIQKRSPLPLLSIIDVAADEAKRLGAKNVLTLGIGITMSRGLFTPALKKRGIHSVVPTTEEQKKMNEIIFQEIVPGKTTSEGTQVLVNLVKKYAKQGSDAVLLGCTELPLVLDEKNCGLPTIDTTRLLALKAVDYACS
jgi:aspartate racemase